jgi:hypothetical protein
MLRPSLAPWNPLLVSPKPVGSRKSEVVFATDLRAMARNPVAKSLLDTSGGAEAVGRPASVRGTAPEQPGDAKATGSGRRSRPRSRPTMNRAAPTGFEPAEPAFKTARRPRFLMRGSPDGIRTRVTGLKGRRPRPLDDGAVPGGWYRTPDRPPMARADRGPVRSGRSTCRAPERPGTRTEVDLPKTP